VETVIPYDYKAVRAAILAHVPELRGELEKYERDFLGLLPGEELEMSHLNGVIELVVWAYLKDAAERRDLGRLSRGVQLVDALMRDGDPEVQNAAVIGVAKPLARTPALRDAFEFFGMGWIAETGDRYNSPALGSRARFDKNPRRRRFWTRWLRL
jgi:hypothetical protein